MEAARTQESKATSKAVRRVAAEGPRLLGGRLEASPLTALHRRLGNAAAAAWAYGAVPALQRETLPLQEAEEAAPVMRQLEEEEEEPEVQAQVEEEEEEPVAASSELNVGAPGDRYEREADAVAARVMAMPESPIRRQELEEEAEEPEVQAQVEEEEEEPVQAKAESTPVVTPEIKAELEATRGSGAPLSRDVRAFMEPRFGRDFGAVRVHAGARAAGLAKELRAQAFTRGADVYFASGKYAPEAAAGKRLLAHELAHTVQQGLLGYIQRQKGSGNKDGSPERSGGAGSGSVATTKGPCGGPSLAKTYTPTDKGITVSLGPKGFGKTSKLAAYFTFGGCKKGGLWKFHLTGLTVKIASKVKPPGFKIEVSAATDAVVTKSSYVDIMNDLRPNGRGKFRVNCAGNIYDDVVDCYSWRRKYWNRQFVVDHEAFHRADWDKMYRKELIQAEKQVWGHSIPESSAANAAGAIKKERANLDGYIASAYQRTCKAYAPKQESRAYADGKPKYQNLVNKISARAKSEGW